MNTIYEFFNLYCHFEIADRIFFLNRACNVKMHTRTQSHTHINIFNSIIIRCGCVLVKFWRQYIMAFFFNILLPRVKMSLDLHLVHIISLCYFSSLITQRTKHTPDNRLLTIPNRPTSFFILRCARHFLS